MAKKKKDERYRDDAEPGHRPPPGGGRTRAAP